ncbi:MAG: Gfo/Idh/MocA family oxidoreductase [Candidatus Fermentibacteraceae bacterium]|nr:Gfo/Idh/MocA family oxidoreductase [Candidatus Fermentibacteraceae bacterium]
MANIGVIGLGYWGPNLLRNIVANRRSDTIVICDKDPGRLNRISERFPACRKTLNAEDIFNDPEIDGVIIATSVSTHYPLAMEAMKAGKHVFVEKPFAEDTEKAEEMVQYAENNNLVTMVGHTFLFSPPVLKIKQILDSKELGDIRFITSSRVNLGLHQKDVSVIWDLAPHDFSMLFYWLNEEPDFVEAFGHDYVLKGIPDVAFINLGFPSGATANVQVAWLAPSKLRKTVIVGSKKMLIYDDTKPYEKIKIFDKGVDILEPETFGEYQLSYRTGDIISPRIDSFEPLHSEMEEFLRCIETGRTPRTSGRSGMGVVKALETADRSLCAKLNR